MRAHVNENKRMVKYSMLKKNLLKISATLGAAALGVAATASVANADTVYTVQSGDTLSGISQKFANNNSLVDSLAKNNNIQNINLIYVGQQLLIKDNGEITQATQAQAQTLPSANTTSTASSQASTNTQAQATTPLLRRPRLAPMTLQSLGSPLANLVVPTPLKMVTTTVSTNFPVLT